MTPDLQIYLLNYHLIWCPKRRKPVLIGKVKSRLKTIIQQVAQEKIAFENRREYNRKKWRV